MPAAKRAARTFVKEWLQRAGQTPVAWTMRDTGVHFFANADGMKIAQYYLCDEPRDGFPLGFRVWFGSTYYIQEFRDADEAKTAVEETWRRWLELAKTHLL
jgi:hypothetical protein